MASRGENAALQGFEGLELWGLVRTLGFTSFFLHRFRILAFWTTGFWDGAFLILTEAYPVNPGLWPRSLI